MLLHLVEQAGYRARIDGEFLQGGVGEIQAAGFIRLMVAEQDYDAAKAMVEEWDNKQPRVAGAEHTLAGNKSGLLFAALFGFLGGLVFAAIVFHANG